MDLGDSVTGTKLFDRRDICVKSSDFSEGSELRVDPLDLAMDIVSEMGRSSELMRKPENEYFVDPKSGVVLGRSGIGVTIEDRATVVSRTTCDCSCSGRLRTSRTTSRICSRAADRL